MTTQECIDKHELSHVESKLSYRDTIPKEYWHDGEIWLPYKFLENSMVYVTTTYKNAKMRFDELRRQLDLSNTFGSIRVIIPLLRSVNVYKFPYQTNGIFICTDMDIVTGVNEHEECETNVSITEFDRCMVSKSVKMYHPILPKMVNYMITLFKGD